MYSGDVVQDSHKPVNVVHECADAALQRLDRIFDVSSHGFDTSEASGLIICVISGSVFKCHAVNCEADHTLSIESLICPRQSQGSLVDMTRNGNEIFKCFRHRICCIRAKRLHRPRNRHFYRDRCWIGGTESFVETWGRYVRSRGKG